MNLDLSQIVRDVLEPMLAEHLNHLEERLVERVAGVVESHLACQTLAPPLLTQADVARHLKVCPRTLQRMISVGEFPPPIPISPSRSRWRQADVDAWLEGR